MPLQSSGAISLANMNSLFGLGYSFNSYRGRGSVPASGPISFSQMYGAILREPASGQNYTLNSTMWKYSGGGGYFMLPAYITVMWGGSTVYDVSGISQSTALNTAAVTVGAWTYYRGSNITTTTDSKTTSGGSTYTRTNYFNGTYRQQ